jgi:predicted CxxxxCH...CXXCH cytochrome family protein
MSQLMIRKISLLIFLAILIATNGCGSTKNADSPFSDGTHPSGWLPAGHMTAARTNVDACIECHGSDLEGGISRVSCTSCHLGGTMSVHPASWGTGTQIALNHAPYVATNGTTGCQNNYCHGSMLAGVAGSGPSCSSCHLGGATSVHPLDWSGAILTKHGAYALSSGTGGCAAETCHGTSLSGVSGSGPSCTSCHIGGVMSGHPADWGSAILTKHGEYAATNGTSGCATETCHGTSLSGVSGSGPGCQSCHQNGVYPFTAMSCTSCHGTPPSGTAYPDQAAAHNTVTGHFVSQVSLPDECATCHVNQGAGTENHFNNVVDVQIPSSYSSSGGPAVYNDDGTCSNISCHGGNITPPWSTGSIDVNNDCTACHSFCAEYNGYCSGQHGPYYSGHSIYCTECHDTNKLAVNHFTSLNTMIMEGPAADTILDSVNYSGGSCTPSCHSTRDWWP